MHGERVLWAVLQIPPTTIIVLGVSIQLGRKLGQFEERRAALFPLDAVIILRGALVAAKWQSLMCGRAAD